MATIYDNKSICGIITKGVSDEKVEIADSAMSGKWSKYINCNIFKQDDDVAYYIPICFNKSWFSQNAPNEYFNYYIPISDYSYVPNNYTNAESTLCWFNYKDLFGWMNDNNKWNSLWTEDQLNRGYNFLKSSHANPDYNTFITNAYPNQDTFIKPHLKHNEDGYDVKYHYYSFSRAVNNGSLYLHASTFSNATKSTDVHITANNAINFKLGYNGILSGYGLTKYIESVDTTDPSGRPFWQRFFFVSIKGGFDASESYNKTNTKSNIKVCTFDQNTGLENETNPYLNSIPLKYKKLRNDVYLVQDDNFRNFRTYSNDNKYVIKRVIQSTGDISYYGGSPTQYISNTWVSDKSEATKFSTDVTPSWWNDLLADGASHGWNASFVGNEGGYSVNISLPMVMNTDDANLNMDRVIYIYGAGSNYVYTGTNNPADYQTGQWTDSYLRFCSGNMAAYRVDWVDDLVYYNRSTNSFTPYYNEATKMSPQELTTMIASDYQYVLFYNDEYWVSGTTYSTIKYTSDLSEATTFSTSAAAQEQIDAIQYYTPDMAITNRDKTGIFYIDGTWDMNATMFSSYEDASNILSKMYNAGEYWTHGTATIYDARNEWYNSKYFKNNKQDSTTTSVNLADIPPTRWLSLNYFIRAV